MQLLTSYLIPNGVVDTYQHESEEEDSNGHCVPTEGVVLQEGHKGPLLALLDEDIELERCKHRPHLSLLWGVQGEDALCGPGQLLQHGAVIDWDVLWFRKGECDDQHGYGRHQENKAEGSQEALGTQPEPKYQGTQGKRHSNEEFHDGQA